MGDAIQVHTAAGLECLLGTIIGRRDAGVYGGEWHG
jgi:hypothetical protein